MPACALAMALSAPLAAAAPPPADWLHSGCTLTGEDRPAQPTPLLLRVRTRPDEAGFDAVLLRMPDGWLYAPAEVFAALEIEPPDDPRRFAATPYFALDRVAGLHYAVDHCTQTLSIDRAGVARSTRRRLAGAGERVYPRPEPGGYLQASSVYVLSDTGDGFSAVADAGVFGGAGLGSSGLLIRDTTATRLDTTWTIDAPGALTRLRLGDSISRGGMFGRSLRFGGVQWGRDFTLRPDLVTFPLPTLSDAAALPSAVDVYVNNALRGRTDVPAGPFEIADVPALSGAGDIQIVVTDVLGRQRVAQFAYYAAPDLLRPGLSDYTVEAGFERRNYTRDSWRYSRGFGAGTWRYGVSDRLTVETHAEGGAQRQAVGAGASLLVPVAGVLSVGLARGLGDSDGGQLMAGLSRQGRIWSYDLSHQVSSPGYLRVGETAPQSTRQDIVRSNWRLPDRASFSIAWLDTEIPQVGRVATLNLGYNRQLRRDLSVNIGVTHDLRRRDEAGDGDFVFVGLSWVLTPQDSVYGSWQRSELGAASAVSLQHSTLGDIGWSARAAAETGLRERVNTALGARTQQALLGIEVEDAAQQAMRLSASSGIVVLGRDIGVTRPLTGPFALVETSSPTPVQVRFENRDAGTVARAQPLLIPNLRPYEANRISVEQRDIAIDAPMDDFDRRVPAPGYGGVRVRFVADTRATRQFVLQLPDGTPLPAGTNLLVDGLPSSSFVGYGGAMLLSGTPGLHTIDARWSQGRCRARAPLAEGDGLLAQPLTVECVPVESGP